MKTTQDLENFIKRLEAVPAYFDNKIKSWNKGITKGYIAPRFGVELAITQIEANIKALDAGVSPFNTHVAKITDPVYLKRAQDALSTHIAVSFKKMHDYLKNKYLPHTTTDHDGIWAQPNGVKSYKKLISYFTTASLDPEVIHQIGFEELKKCQTEMLAIASKLGFTGTLQEFFIHVRQDPNNFFKTRDEVYEAAAASMERAKSFLPKLFINMPPAQYEVRKIDPVMEQSAAAGYAGAPDQNFTRPGYFYINTYLPETRARYLMDSLSAHEGLPGHLLQVSTALMLKDLPRFRASWGNTAYVEGWAHYSELLMSEVGFYRDELSMFGMWSDQAWRAARLVVDTGIHHKKWSRAQALKFFMENTAIAQHNAQTEINRYAVSPGQALAYKIGQREFLRLRELAKQELGSKFDIKQYHSVVLSEGGVPMSVLSEVVQKWINSLKQPKD